MDAPHLFCLRPSGQSARQSNVGHNHGNAINRLGRRRWRLRRCTFAQPPTSAAKFPDDRYFNQDLSDNAKRGVRNEVSGVKLLQRDLSEAWRENGSDYATVAMRFSHIDATVDRATGQVVSGDRTRPTEATEFWTFRRDDRARRRAGSCQSSSKPHRDNSNVVATSRC